MARHKHPDRDYEHVLVGPHVKSDRSSVLLLIAVRFGWLEAQALAQGKGALLVSGCWEAPAYRGIENVYL